MHSVTLQAYSGIFYGKPTPIEKGDRVILPQTILANAFSGPSQQSLKGPMMFKITNPANNKSIHCGVLEFSPQNGKIFLPWWMMNSIHLVEGDKITLDRVDLPNGTFVQLQPHDKAFQQIDQPKAIFATLSEGSTIIVHHQDQDFSLTITKTKPAKAINIINTDLSVDFLPLPEDMSAQENAPPPKISTPQKKGSQFDFMGNGGDDDSSDETDDDEEEEDYFASMKVNRIGDAKINVKPLKKTSSIHTPLSPPAHLAIPMDHNNMSTSLQSQGSLFFANMRKHATSQTNETENIPVHTLDPEKCCFNCYTVFESAKKLAMHETQCVRKTWTCFLCGDRLERAKPLMRTYLRKALDDLKKKQKAFNPSQSNSSFPPSPDPSLDPPNLTDPYFNDSVIHTHIETVHKRVNCEQCGTKMEVAELISHQNLTCPFRDVICEYCGVGIKHNEFKEHQSFCGSRSEKCHLCGELVLLKDRDLHLTSGCSKGKLADRSPRSAQSYWLCPFCKTPQSNDLSLVAVHVLTECKSVERGEDGRVSESVLEHIDPEFLRYAGISFNTETHSIHSIHSSSRGPSTISSPIMSGTTTPTPSTPTPSTPTPSTPDFTNMTDDERLAAAIAASLNANAPPSTSTPTIPSKSVQLDTMYDESSDSIYDEVSDEDLDDDTEDGDQSQEDNDDDDDDNDDIKKV